MAVSGSSVGWLSRTPNSAINPRVRSTEWSCRGHTPTVTKAGLKCTRLLFLLAMPATGTAQLRIFAGCSSDTNIGTTTSSQYSQMIDYWQKLDRESDRMKLVRIGTTAEGRPMWMAIITSPENHRRLARYQEISRRLALAENLTDAQARALAAEGKAVVWIDGGLHASEVLGAQQLIQTVYELVSRTDPETLRFLRDDIILCVPANPDGQDLVSNWYMRDADTLKRTTSRLPRLYQKYAGHDNNRDSYMAVTAGDAGDGQHSFRAWYPQICTIITDRAHRDGIFAPTFRDPSITTTIPRSMELESRRRGNAIEIRRRGSPARRCEAEPLIQPGGMAD